MKRKKQPTHNYYKKKIAKKLEKGILALGFLHPFSVSIVFCFAMSKLENEALYALYYWTTYLVLFLLTLQPKKSATYNLSYFRVFSYKKEFNKPRAYFTVGVKFNRVRKASTVQCRRDSFDNN